MTHRTLLVFSAVLLTASLGPAFDEGSDEEAVFSIFVTGADQGVLEPCGCTGGQLGGIGRRAFLLEALTYGDTPALLLSTGGLPGGNDRLHALRYEIILICLTEMGYHAVGLGPEELDLGLERLRTAGRDMGYPLILSNVTYPEENDVPFLPFTFKNIGGFRVMILAAIPESLCNDLPEDALFEPPGAAIEKATADNPDADLYVLLLRGTRREAKMLDRFLPDPKLIFYSYPHSEPQVYEFGKREGLIRHLSPGDRGRFIQWCGMNVDVNGMLTPGEPTNVPLQEEDYPESEIIQAYMDWYRQGVLDEKILEHMVEVNPAPEGAPFAGSESCILCHEKAWETWKQSGHATAFSTLIESKREFDPECISCHTTGFGFVTGFKKPDSIPELINVGCESCHGPCSKHVQSAGRVPTPQKIECSSCHDLDHSSGFYMEEYWEKIRCLPDDPPDWIEKGK